MKEHVYTTLFNITRWGAGKDEPVTDALPFEYDFDLVSEDELSIPELHREIRNRLLDEYAVEFCTNNDRVPLDGEFTWHIVDKERK